MDPNNPNKDVFDSFREGISEFGQKMGKFVEDVFSAEQGGEIPIRTDIYRNKEAFVVEMELPGVKKEDVSIQVHDGILHVRGKKDPVEGSIEFLYERRGRLFGEFLRTYPLPVDVELEGIKARFDAGILTIRFPLPQKPEPPKEEGNINIE